MQRVADLGYLRRVHVLRRVSVVVLFGAATHAVAPAAAANPAGKLRYARGAGAESCPNEEQFRQAVAARLGEDPFSEQAARSFRVELLVREARLVGHVLLNDERDAAQGVRTFEASGDCAELAAAVALAVSLAINPDLDVSREAPSEASAKPPESVSEPAPISTKAPPLPPSVPEASDPVVSRENDATGGPDFALGAGLFGLGVAGIAPVPSVGGALALGIRRGRVSISLEGRYDAPARDALGQAGSFESSVLSGVVAPCWHHGEFAGCAVGLVGRIHGESRDAPNDGSDNALYAAAGARLAAELPLVSHVSIGGRVELLGTLAPVHFVRNQARRVWDTPSASVTFGLGVVAQIP